jgi:hypothetical protein
MNSSMQKTTHAQAQGRQPVFIEIPMRLLLSPSRLGAILFLVLLAVPVAQAQEVADTIRVRTRVVFMDALVKEKKTGIPISDLKPENFELFDDGKPRTISYFTREGQARKPLALVIILDCRDDGAGRFLKRPEVLKAMADELAKLPPEDEVAVRGLGADLVERGAARLALHARQQPSPRDDFTELVLPIGVPEDDPVDLVERSPGVRYCAIVSFSAAFSPVTSGKTSCTLPLPNVCCPTMTARSWFLRAPATISLALAEF